MVDGTDIPGRWTESVPAQRQLVIVGAGEFADIAYEYFTHDSPYEVVGFAVERAHLAQDRLNGLPVVALEDVQGIFPPDRCSAFVAVTYTRLNRIRARLHRLVKQMGYRCARYVSSAAFVWHNVALGENVFVFEHNVVQHNARVGDGVVLWSGNHIGHRSRVGDYCYVASHAVVSGFCSIGDYSFLGVNVTVADRVNIGRSCVVGAGALVLKDLADDVVLQGLAPSVSRVPASRLHRLKEGE